MTRRSDDRTRRPEPRTPPAPAPTPEHVDELLDEALEETFPASDPPALTRPYVVDDRPPAPPRR
jgi:hypothetical protein